MAPDWEDLPKIIPQPGERQRRCFPQERAALLKQHPETNPERRLPIVFRFVRFLRFVSTITFLVGENGDSHRHKHRRDNQDQDSRTQTLYNAVSRSNRLGIVKAAALSIACPVSHEYYGC